MMQGPSPRKVKLTILLTAVALIMILSSQLTALMHVRQAPLSFTPEQTVFIVEEHHEVLEYWFDAVKRGLLTEKGNTLLHIDGHSDSATPETFESVRRMPVDRREITLMMNKNDVFIQAAAMTGLVQRFIWVWPSYEGVNHDRAHVILNITLGVAYKRSTEVNPWEIFYEAFYCACISDEERNECLGIVDDAPIPSKDCRNQTWAILVEIVSVDKAIELAQKGTWIKPTEKVILDIDEDFYACESASQILYAKYVSKTMQETLTRHIGQVFCVGSAGNESLADDFFNLLCSALIEAKQVCLPGKSNCLKSEQILEKTLNDASGLPYWKTSIMCFPFEHSVFLLKNLLQAMSGLSVEQLEVVRSVGICLGQSSKSTFFRPTDGMVLCKGYNDPDSKIVTFHSTTPKEIDETTVSVKKILTQDFIPRVITVCRSVRDGYTPRAHFSQIETDVLHVLKFVYPGHVTEDTIHYDSQLLGGKKGWYGRHTVHDVLK